jgi:hypothetical protein
MDITKKISKIVLSVVEKERFMFGEITKNNYLFNLDKYPLIIFINKTN